MNFISFKYIPKANHELALRFIFTKFRYTIVFVYLRIFSHCSIRVSRLFHVKHVKLQLFNFYKVNPAPFMLEYNLQPVVTSFISIALITV